MATTTTTTVAPSSGLSDVILASGGFLAGVLFLSFIELIVSRPNQVLVSQIFFLFGATGGIFQGG